MTRSKAKLHEVTIVATRKGENFHFEPSCEIWNPQESSFRFHKDHHHLRKQDFHLVEFVLDDQTDEHLRFPRTPHQAMWVTRSSPGKSICPNKNTQSDYDVLDPISVSDDAKRLIVRNDNPRAEQWAFTLNFTRGDADDADAERYVSWDPIIDNHNGGS